MNDNKSPKEELLESLLEEIKTLARMINDAQQNQRQQRRLDAHRQRLEQ